MATFVDRVVLHCSAGNGGHGCASIHREKFKPLGGPDGGNGGHGGDVVLVVDPSVHTLLDFHFHPHQRAGNGKQGAGSNRDGANGDDLELRVPDGTVVQTADGEVLADLIGAGTRFVVARGGRGGLGNARAGLATAARRPASPCSASRARPATSCWSSRASPTSAWSASRSAGKSSLIAALSAARPKIADYPFTTLVPNLGVVQAGDDDVHGRRRARPDPGRGQGKGLGLEFLRHIERCAVLVHVVDCATAEPGRDPVADIDAIERELAAVRHGAGRPAAAGRAEQDRRAGRRGTWPRSSGPTWRRAAGRSSRSARPPARA